MTLFFVASLIITVMMVMHFDLMRFEFVRYHGKAPYHMLQLVGEGYSQIVEINYWKLKHLHGDGGKKAMRDRQRHFHHRAHEEFETNSCKAMHSWQLESYPNCNAVHETNMYEVAYISNGAFRDVWKMQDIDGGNFVMKTLTWRKDYVHREYDRHRRDAVAMSLLASSEHIPNIYANCKLCFIFC